MIRGEKLTGPAWVGLPAGGLQIDVLGVEWAPRHWAWLARLLKWEPLKLSWSEVDSIDVTFGGPGWKSEVVIHLADKRRDATFVGRIGPVRRMLEQAKCGGGELRNVRGAYHYLPPGRPVEKPLRYVSRHRP